MYFRVLEYKRKEVLLKYSLFHSKFFKYFKVLFILKCMRFPIHLNLWIVVEHGREAEWIGEL